MGRWEGRVGSRGVLETEHGLQATESVLCFQHPPRRPHVLPPPLPNAHGPLHLTRNSPQLLVSCPALNSHARGPTAQPPLCLFFSVFWRPFSVSNFVSSTPSTDTPMLSSFKASKNPSLCLTRPVYIFSNGAGVVRLLWGFFALPGLIIPQSGDSVCTPGNHINRPDPFFRFVELRGPALHVPLLRDCIFTK